MEVLLVPQWISFKPSGKQKIKLRFESNVSVDRKKFLRFWKQTLHSQNVCCGMYLDTTTRVILFIINCMLRLVLLKIHQY